VPEAPKRRRSRKKAEPEAPAEPTVLPGIDASDIFGQS
jgi:hypothetical protein